MRKHLVYLSMTLLVSACSADAVRPDNTLNQSGSVVSLTNADSTGWKPRRNRVLTPPEVELPVADSAGSGGKPKPQ